MGLALKIAVFMLFLVLYGLWLWGNGKLFGKQVDEPSFARKTWIQIPIALSQYVAFFVFIWLLSGFWSWPLIFLMIAAAPLGTLVTAILWGLQGSTDSRWYSRSGWAGGELGFKHPAAFFVALGIGMLVLIAYPIVSGISYFADNMPPQHQIRIIQYTLAILVFSSLGTAPMLIGALTSEYLDENTRIRILTGQFGLLIPYSLFVALLFLTFGVGGEAMTVDLVGTISLALSIPTLVVVVGYFILTMLIPFFIGTRRARNFRSTLAEREIRWLLDIIQTLKVPTNQYYADRLEKLQQNVTQSLQAFVEKDSMIKIGIQIDAGTAPPEIKTLANMYRKCRDMDPRFTHLDWTKQLLRRIDQVSTDLSGKSTDAEAVQAAAGWVGVFETQKADIEARSEAADKSASPVTLVTYAVVTPIMTVVLTGIGNVLWAIISTSAAATH